MARRSLASDDRALASDDRALAGLSASGREAAPAASAATLRRAVLVGAAAAWSLVGLDALAARLGLWPSGLPSTGPTLAVELGLVGLLAWLGVSLGHPRAHAGRLVRGGLLVGVAVAVALVLLTGGQAGSRAELPGAPLATLLHWGFAALVLPLILGAMWLARPAGRGRTGPAFELTVTAAALYVIELMVGAAGAFSSPEPWVAPVHLLLGASVLACLVAAAAQLVTGAEVGPGDWSGSTIPAGRPLPALPGEPTADPATGATVEAEGDGLEAPATARRPGARAARAHPRLRAYVALTKPRIIELLLVTTVPAMALAAPQVPGLQPGSWLALVLWTLIGGTLAAGSANAINQYIDRDIDARMSRTRRRPLPGSTLDPQQALLFSVALGVAAFALLLLTTNLLAAVLTLVANAFYVVVYTIMLKRTTVQNIVIGGAAGSLPPLIGWAAVTGDLAPAPVLLFLIVFFWTPPHFWALALRLKDDYAAAGVPMLPVVRGVRETNRQILLYTVAVVALTLLLVPVAGMGLVYLVGAAGSGGLFLAQAVALWRDGSAGPAMRVYRGSITYLAGVFAAIALDVLLPLHL
ncbi:MAG TPA: heme o synthase [Candidatus Limnocylindrales bacterium]|nr:heme o synthase [Candidatus Limnocylindrales bacterium]